MRTTNSRGALVVWAVGMTLCSIASADPGRDPTASAQSVGDIERSSAETPPEAIAEPEPDQPGRTPPIENAEALAPFFEALAWTEAGDGITRVTHLGDSSIGLDGIPHGMRRRLQARFGDAGAGFVLLEQPTDSYINRTVQVRSVRPWRSCVVVRRCRRDGHYGLGGVLADSRGGSMTTIAPRDGRSMTRAELWYLAQPRGGRVRFEFGDQQVELDTEAEALEDRWHLLEGEGTVRVRALGSRVRAYGVVLENDGPGVVWDSLPLVGAFTHRMLAFDEAHFARQLAHRNPNLVVLSFGGNDLRRIVGRTSPEALQEETEEVLGRVRRAVPDAACLLIGINDHTASGSSEVQPRHIEAVIGAQRRAAFNRGCAFWDQVEAMGGAGSFRSWRRHGLAAADGKHLSARGREVIAARLHAALMHARP